MQYRIVVTGHSYAFPYYFKFFEYSPKKDELVFLLPKVWWVKGKVKIDLSPRLDFKTYGLTAISYGGHGLGGLFKGWLPVSLLLLPYLRLRYKSRILYSCSEPNILTTFFNGLAAKICGMRLVLFTWQNVSPEDRLRGLKLKLANILTGINLQLADGVVCGNKKAEAIVKVFNKNLKTIVCPVSGVDTDKFHTGIKSDWREKLKIVSDEKLILFYGALDKRKGLDVLVDAFKLLNDQDTKAKLVIVGTGPMKEDLKSKIYSLKLNDKTIFLDWMPNHELPALLNIANVFLCPSLPTRGWEEQFGYAMAEASACGLPVVATRIGSIDEVVVDGKSGLLVPPNNISDLAEAISKILSDPDLAKKMGEYGREYVNKNFSHQVVVDKMLGFIRSF